MTELRRTRIKVCGITRAEDALSISGLGVDAIGLVFFAGSPRCVTADRARTICRILPPLLTTVGLFVDADAAFVRETLARCPLDLLQFHGKEGPEYCASFERPYIKAIRMRSVDDLWAGIDAYGTARGLLLDTYRPGIPGGTGETFDWTEVPDALNTPIILAGGLKASNVGPAIGQLRPWAVDVSGGVESAQGIKDVSAVSDFVAAVATADRNQ